jgi:hypothetical protein
MDPMEKMEPESEEWEHVAIVEMDRLGPRATSPSA